MQDKIDRLVSFVRSNELKTPFKSTHFKVLDYHKYIESSISQVNMFAHDTVYFKTAYIRLHDVRKLIKSQQHGNN